MGYRCDGGGGKAGSVAGGGGNAEPADGVAAGSGKGLAARLCGVMTLAAVLVLDVDLETLRRWIGFGGGGTACSTTCTGFGTRLGGGFSQNEWSGGAPVAI